MRCTYGERAVERLRSSNSCSAWLAAGPLTLVFVFALNCRGGRWARSALPRVVFRRPEGEAEDALLLLLVLLLWLL